MKKKIVCFFVLVALCLVVNSCSDEKVENVPAEQTYTLKETQMKELIQYVRDIAPSPVSVETRGFWKNMVNWFKRVGTADASGFGWGKGSGANLGQSLRIAATTSLIAATNQSDVRLEWKINNEWKIYPSSAREYQEMGNNHNKIIYELVQENPALKNGTLSDNVVLSLVDKKAMKRLIVQKNIISQYFSLD